MESSLVAMATTPPNHRPPLLPLSSLLLLLLVHPFLSAATPSITTKAVPRLPGFSGPLPFCLETGYVELDDGVRLFYYFIQSERDPEEDPVLLWLTGGPGCSALSGLVYEIGPFYFDFHGYMGGLPTLLYKPASWTKGVIAGNPLTDTTTNFNAQVPFLHGMGIIPDEIYEAAREG